jgi:hypothetical protein
MIIAIVFGPRRSQPASWKNANNAPPKHGATVIPTSLGRSNSSFKEWGIIDSSALSQLFSRNHFILLQ